MNVIGLDASADRIAWAELADGFLQSSGQWDCRKGIPAVKIFTALGPQATVGRTIFCLEINLRPLMVNKGRISPQMVKNYMRSRWMEGRLLHVLGFPEPVQIERKRGGFLVPSESKIYSLQAKSEGNRSGKEAKAERRRRMTQIYTIKHKVSQDVIDALAIAHDATTALKMGFRGDSNG